LIVTGKNGRRGSVLTVEEVQSKFDKSLVNLTDDEMQLMSALSKELGEDESEVHDALYDHTYRTRPVNMQEFIENPYYLGEGCASIYPQLKSDLIRLFDSTYREFLTTGSIGVGKSYGASIVICRLLYEYSCMISPQRSLGLSPASTLVIPLISKNLALSRDVLKAAVDEKIKMSPYFMRKCSPDIRKDYTLFPNGVRVNVGSYISDRVLGTDVIACIFDECLTKKSVVTFDNDGVLYHLSVADLVGMVESERCNHKIMCLDHGNGKLRSGSWRIKESTVQPLVSIGTQSSELTLSHDHPVLVKRGEWFVYCHARDICLGDTVLVEDGYAKRVCGSCNSWKGAYQANGDEFKFAGVRRERLGTLSVPSGLHEECVDSVEFLSPEQTYSICTEYDTFIADGVVVHNTNFPPKRHGQQIATGFGQRIKAAHYDIVEKMYRGMVRRIKSRFQKAGGGFPGMVILASSAATTESFTERKMRESREDPEFFVLDHTQWTVKPDEKFCGDKFYVLCSTSATKSRIISDDEYYTITDEYLDANDAFIMDIPIEFKDDFEANMEDSLRDIAGFSTEAISQFIQRPKKIVDCTNEDREHPFDREEWVSGGPGKIDWEKLVRKYERRLPGGYTEDAYKPIINPNAMRWCHIDTSVSGDATGFCIGHIDRWIEVVRTDIEGGKYADMEPFYIMDFMLRILPPPAEQIYMPDIRVLMYKFMDMGFQFSGMSTDTYQYVEMHQQIKRRGVKPYIISMDTSVDPYEELKSAFYENRIEIYHYDPFITEFKQLEYDRLVGKIDKPLAGSDDVSDGVAGCVWGLKQFGSRVPMTREASVKSGVSHDHSWVSPLVPADKIDNDTIIAAKESVGRNRYVPILFGDED